ncbi:MAG TPA: type IV secretion system DNA-binding domain-containing protein [Candidatus Saccharimonadales bacterium]|nr:type IV secretion system DNA-binding domain-containing protein [Candidatus Saccharimonadales bacterium]
MILGGRNKIAQSHQHCLLMLEVPRTNDKKELAAEQMLAALHGILRSKKELRLSGTLQEHISLEVAAIGQRIRFYIWTPKHLQAFVEGQIYAQYPTVQIFEQQEDYAERRLHQTVIHTSELSLVDAETIPIKTFPSFEVDPLAAITATLAKLDREDEEMWIQIMARPIHDDWHRKGAKDVARIKRGSGILGGAGGSMLGYAGEALAALVRPPTGSGESKAPEISERDKGRITAIEEKSKKLGYEVKIRLLYAGHDQHTAKLRMQALVGAFKQFNSTNLNGFAAKNPSFSRDKQLEYQTRFFITKGFILNIEELASLFHLPHTSVETPNIVWATTKTAEPPSNVPIAQPGMEDEISLFGVTNFRGDNTIFGILRADRGRHVYILGQTGTGKSGGLELLTLSDIYYDQGFAVIDPHGDYAQHILRFIPERRLDDVIYFNPADTEFPIGFNPLEISDPSLKGHISSELVGVLKRLFADSWGPRLEYILRYTLLALLDYPNSTMLDITRMLTDKKFRKDVISYIDDPVVKNFWVTEFASWNDKFAAEAVAPVLNKVGAFTANPMIRNIIGQPKSTFNIRKIMDEGKILVVNLSRGLMGEDNAGILGAMMVTKIQLAAMGRADMHEHERRPFYLYVDEFQNFATDSFAVILSEARKYGLNLTVANQYISQMSEAVRDAVFGNVGTIVSFRISPDDAPFLQKYFEPQFEAADLIQQHSRFFVTTMMINGEKAPAFSAKTLNLPQPPEDVTKQIIELSRQRYSGRRQEVEEAVRERAGLNTAPLLPEVPAAGDNLRPKARARVIEASKASPTHLIGKAVTNLLATGDGGSKQNQAEQAGSTTTAEVAKTSKRRRGRRGKGSKAKTAATAPKEATPAEVTEETVKLR